jgi:hypothetical protein
MPTWVIVLLSRSVALVAISNGLGHLRRQLAFYKHLISQGYDVTVFCHLDDLEKLSVFNVKAEQLKIRVSDLPSLVKNRFFEDLSTTLNKFDIVVSDNCVDVLRSRQDAILFASFFWHRAISMPDWYGQDSEALIESCNPIIIANRLFVADYLQHYGNLHLVGFFGKQRIKAHHKADDLLLSFGFSNELNSYFVDIVDYVTEFCMKEGRKLWLEPRYFNHINVKCSFIVEASYTDEMYKSIDMGIVRPGIGTLTNLIGVRSKIVCVHEENNKEMLSNSRRIVDNRFGINAPNIDVLAELLKSPNFVPRIKLKRAQDEFDGEIKSFKVIEAIG